MEAKIPIPKGWNKRVQSAILHRKNAYFYKTDRGAVVQRMLVSSVISPISCETITYCP